MIRRWLARCAYWTAGLLTHVKTPQRSWLVVSTDPFRVEKSPEQHWSSCRLSIKVLKWSMRLDPDCWEHWALVHERCNPIPCPVCDGGICTADDDD